MNLIYNRFAPEVEIYSIDESFLYFPAWNTDFTGIGRQLKETVTRETGIPVSIGIAPNKTLAKMCNKLAKKQGGGASGGGVCDWNTIDQEQELRGYPVEDIWGVGPSKAAILKRRGITTALGLKHYPLHEAKKHLTISGFKTVQELNGVTAIDKIEEAPRQAVMVSRSFQSPVYEMDDIITALSDYTQEAVKRMRDEGLSCRFVSVYLMTNAFAQGEQYSNQQTAELPHLSAYLPEIQVTANELIKRIFRPNYKYRKVMVGLTGLGFDNNPQFQLFDTAYNKSKILEPLMKAFDSINDRYGRGTIRLGCGLKAMETAASMPHKTVKSEGSPWETKREYLSPRYTTSIKEIPAAL